MKIFENVLLILNNETKTLSLGNARYIYIYEKKALILKRKEKKQN